MICISFETLRLSLVVSMALVNKSANWSFVPTWATLSSFRSICSSTNASCALKCLVLAVALSDCTTQIALWLSHSSFDGISDMIWSSIIILLIHASSFEIEQIAIISDSVDNKLTCLCNCDFQWNTPPLCKRAHPVVDLLDCLSPAKSLSQYPTKQCLFSLLL